MNSPLAQFTVDPTLNILARSEAARERFGDVARLDELVDRDTARGISAGTADRLRTTIGDDYVDIFVRTEGTLRHIAIVEINEQRHLQEQLKTAKQPDRRTLRNLANLVATIRTQGELVSTMLEHGDAFSPQQLKVIRGCQAEVNAKLARCEELIQELRERRVVTERAHGPVRLVIWHPIPERAELISELFRLERYAVDCFSSTTAVADLMRIDAADIQVVITAWNGDLVNLLFQRNPDLRVVVLAPRDSRPRDSRVYWFEEGPLDINELLAFVTGLVRAV